MPESPDWPFRLKSMLAKRLMTSIRSLDITAVLIFNVRCQEIRVRVKAYANMLMHAFVCVSLLANLYVRRVCVSYLRAIMRLWHICTCVYACVCVCVSGCAWVLDHINMDEHHLPRCLNVTWHIVLWLRGNLWWKKTSLSERWVNETR